MSSVKILVLDSSITIQKVIGIMLANGPYELVQCTNPDQLENLLTNASYDLFVADYNFLPDKNGQEFVQVLRAKAPLTKIMIMLGTFDTVNEDEMFNAGVGDFIVKPFESSKFIQKCQLLMQKKPAESKGQEDLLLKKWAGDPFSADIQMVEQAASATDVTSTEIPVDLDNSNEGWVVNAPEIQENTSWQDQDNDQTAILTPSSMQDKNPLAQEVEGWGMSVPEVIGQSPTEDTVMEIPGVIVGQTPKIKPARPPVVHEVNEDFTLEFPEQTDLEYPAFTSATDLQATSEKSEKVSSKLISLGELKLEDDTPDFEDADRTTSIEMPALLDNALEEEIGKELSNADFWSADEEFKVDLKEEKVKEHPIPNIEDFLISDKELAQVEIKPLEMAKEEKRQAPVDVDAIVREIKKSLPTFDKEEMVREIKKSLPIVDERAIIDAIKPILDQFVKNYCQKTVEHIAWEIIPDLAENLIKKQLKEISESIRD
ncbi:MAG: response regulator [Pseudomonadota bacterium]